MDWDEAPDGLNELLGLSTMTLSTCDESGRPHAAPVYFAADPAFRLFFYSHPDSLHCRHLAAKPNAAAAIHAEAASWAEIRGLQMHGTVAPLSPGAVMQAAEAEYQRKFPFTAGMTEILARNRLYCLTPTWIRMIDNRRSFGWKHEMRSAPVDLEVT